MTKNARPLPAKDTFTTVVFAAVLAVAIVEFFSLFWLDLV